MPTIDFEEFLWLKADCISTIRGVEYHFSFLRSFGQGKRRHIKIRPFIVHIPCQTYDSMHGASGNAS